MKIINIILIIIGILIALFGLFLIISSFHGLYSSNQAVTQWYEKTFNTTVNTANLVEVFMIFGGAIVLIAGVLMSIFSFMYGTGLFASHTD